MRNGTFRNTADIFARRRKRRAWQKILIALSCVVVFCTTYALILPAITMENTSENCEIQEHTHTESCYTQVTSVSKRELVCTNEQLEHVHTDECYQTVEETVDPAALTCQLEASDSHRHGALCYGTWELNCTLEAHTHSAECAGTRQISPLSEEAAVSTAPLALEDYIKTAVLNYRTSPDADWQRVDASTALPGNAELQLDISYEKVHVDTLRDAGLQMTFTLPPILRNPTGGGSIYDSNKKQMGTMTLENGVVTLLFDDTWLKDHTNTTGATEVSGTFQVESGIDLTAAAGNPSMQITIGDVTIDLHFESDIIAKYAEVTIQKNDPVAIHDDSGDYLEYTLSVTAGADGAPDVVVKDAFENPGQILGYVGLSEAAPDGHSGTFSMDGNTMVWNIGTMAPHETRSLTYRVKPKDGYLGGKVPEALITNTAELYCGGHSRGEDNGIFTPKADATMSKVASHFTPDPDGGGTIQYTVWIHAMDTNTYTLTNVKIWDALDGSIDGRGVTDAKYLPYLSFVEDSFRLYDGGSNMQNGASGLTPEGGIQVTPIYQENADGTPNPYYISCDVDTLAPGESKTLTYTLHVDPGVFPAAGNNTPAIHNRAQIHAGDAANGNETALNSYNATLNIQKKVWSSKLPGTKQAADTTVSVSGNVYAADGSLVENHPTEFTAPAGSYLYHVSVNEAGDWDVSNASLKDQLQGEYAKYIGYVRVEAFNVDASGNRTIANTVWLSVDGGTEFTFTPREIGLTGSQAYELTYYTSVTIPAGAPQVNVENTFVITGGVGIGSYTYIMEGAYVTASNIIEGSNSFSVSKHGWYYEPPKVDTGEYANGAIYWYIQVDGTQVPANTYLRDETSWNTQYMYDSSLVGLYTGNLGVESVSGYDDLEDLLASNKLTRLDESGYSFEIAGTEGRFPYMTVHLTKDVPLSEGESLFLIIKIEPNTRPYDLTGTEQRHYKNEVKSSYNGSNWVAWGGPKTLSLYGSNGIYKTLEKVSSWNGTAETVVIPEGGTATPAALASLENGTYVFWNVQLNYPGRLHGSYCVEETIPAGLKLAYVECTGVGSGYPNAAKPSCVQKSPGDGWTEYQRTQGVLPTYYYTNAQTARWYVDGLQSGNNNHTVDFRVACRVTDADVLLGGTEKEFQNQVQLLRESGKVIDSSASAVTLQFHSLHKEGNYSPELDGTRFPFVITLNPLGEDLVPGADTLSLVDTLSQTLKLDITSIQVKETGTDTLVTNWESAVNGQTLTLTLPDQMPLTVTYSAWINARPGDRISISNDAHWEGYPTPDSGAVKNDNFEFSISGSADTDQSPIIQITKLDENHLSSALQGAKFTLTKAVAQADGTIVETTEINWIGETDENGSLSFGYASDQTMEYNTIYCLRETQAPTGYVLDSTPYYFAIAKKVTVDGADVYPTFPDQVYVHYLGSTYSYQALNHKGCLIVQKKFSDLSGNDYGPVAGTYTFGLYDTVGESGLPEGAPLKTASISYSAADTVADKTAVFQDLALDQSYYVFELDASGNPVSGGGTLSDCFVVSYQYPGGGLNYAALTAENGDQTVTVINAISTPELPKTGGMGTTIFCVAGSVLLAGASLMLFAKKRARVRT